LIDANVSFNTAKHYLQNRIELNFKEEKTREEKKRRGGGEAIDRKMNNK
jgi:hypothetical protein